MVVTVYTVSWTIQQRCCNNVRQDKVNQWYITDDYYHILHSLIDLFESIFPVLAEVCFSFYG